jgi:xanthine dehydrogenase large subunit
MKHLKNTDSEGHVSGKSVYLDDIPLQMGTKWAAIFLSPKAHGKISKLDFSKALAMPGVLGILSSIDIPGENQIGGIIPDEPLFADGEVHYQGQPIAMVVADSELIAKKALSKIEIEIEEWEVITDPRIAFKKGHLLIPPQKFESGNIDEAWKKCSYIFEGIAETGGQEHLYIETQGAYAYPKNNGSLMIHSSTQGPTAVQRTAAKILNIPMHKIEVDVVRLGGGFGGKEDQATPFACMVALAALQFNLPVKIALHRMDDIKMTGKRNPYTSDFKIGLNDDLKIIAYEAHFYQNSGAASDLSPAILDRTLFHACNAYHIPNTRFLGYSCKTNLPPNTAFRGFGGPQGMFVIEAAIAKAAHALGIKAIEIQKRNLLQENDHFHYGQVAQEVYMQPSFEMTERVFDVPKMEAEIETFNLSSKHIKKGMALMPMAFGISFTKTSMNQARALIHIYQDGSIGLSTGAVEMGQGVNTKILQVAGTIFSVKAHRIKLESTNTTRVSNTSPTAASAGADLNGKATEIAARNLLHRLKTVGANMCNADLSEIEIKDEWIWCKGEKTDISWEKLINKAFLERVNLSEHGHYATPIIYFDPSTGKGHPFAYHVYGTAIFVVSLDCIRGRYHFDKVLLVHDFGNSMNMAIDMGQIEGGLVQGIGWMTMEEVSYADNGKLLSNSLSTYKIPDIYSVPSEIRCVPLELDGHELAIFKSKAVGEPPLLYGIGAYFALQNAIMAFNKAYQPDFNAPLTPEKVLNRLYTH